MNTRPKLHFFSRHRHGRWVATNPRKTISISLLLVGLCGLGLFNFYMEKNMVKLWIPEDSDFAKNNAWLWDNFPPDLR